MLVLSAALMESVSVDQATLGQTAVVVQQGFTGVASCAEVRQYYHVLDGIELKCLYVYCDMNFRCLSNWG